jgi:hypothetical protein
MIGSGEFVSLLVLFSRARRTALGVPSLLI